MTKQRTIYLAGPMEHVSKDQAQGWRDQVKLHFHYDSLVTLLDPCRRLHSFKQEEMRAIFELDIRDINESDIVLANLSQLGEIPHNGTSMEVFYANYIRRIPVIGIKPTKKNMHPFFESLVTEWVPDVNTALDTLRNKYL